MKSLALQTYIQALKAKIRAMNERTAIARLARINSAFGRKLPMEFIEDEPDSDALAAALASRGDGQASGESPSGQGDVNSATATAKPGEVASNDPDTVGQGVTVNIGSGTQNGAGRKPRNGWPISAVIATTVATTIGLGTLSNLAVQRLTPKDRPANPAVVEKPSRSLYQYLEDEGYHLPPQHAEPAQ